MYLFEVYLLLFQLQYPYRVSTIFPIQRSPEQNTTRVFCSEEYWIECFVPIHPVRVLLTVLLVTIISVVEMKVSFGIKVHPEKILLNTNIATTDLS